MSIKVNVEIHSIRQIEAQAKAALDQGASVDANPYAAGSTAHRVWAVSYERLAKACIAK